jgi:predicted Zn-dependent protease
MRKKRRLELQAIVDRVHRLLVLERYDEMLGVTAPAIERFPDDPELWLMHGTALFWSRPEEAAWQLATAVSLDMNNPRLVTRAANLLLSLGEFEAVEDYLDHAETADGSNEADLVGEIALLRHQLSQAREH